MTEPGVLYLVYLQTGGSVDVDLTAATGELGVNWLNPRTGQLTNAGTVAGGGARSFSAPDNNDWLLQVESIDVQPPIPPSALTVN